MRYVAVVGPGDGARESDCEQARAVGVLLGRAGVTVITGGLGGVMAAAAAGARQAGAQVIGLLPGTSRADASDDVTVAVPTGLGELRNGLVVRAADAVIAVGGSWGTLSEIALARRTGVPVVCLGGWTVHDETGEPVPLEVVDSPEHAVRRVLSELSALPPAMGRGRADNSVARSELSALPRPMSSRRADDSGGTEGESGRGGGR